MPYAIGYARFSSTKQGKGTSLDRQQELIANWIAENPAYTIYPKKFQDLGRSASKGDHLKHGFGQLLEAIKLGEVGEGDVILVEAIDRIGRLPETQMISLIHDIITAKVKIITLEDGNTYGPVIRTEQIWSLIGKVQQAYLYSKTLSRRIKSSYKTREELARNGIIPKRRTPIWLNTDGTLKPRIAAAMKNAFEDALAGVGERRILKRLISVDSAFEKINPSTIRRWLINKAAIGYWREYKIYPSIVTDELFYQVQQRFLDEYKPATAARVHFLSGLVKCGECGANMQVKAYKNSPYAMRCTTRSAYGDLRCRNNKTIPVPVLQHICNDTATLAVEAAMRNIELSEAKKKTIVIEGQLKEVRTKIENLTISLEKYGPLPELDEKLTKLLSERKRLQNEKLFASSDSEREQSKYEDAWDYQYELIEENPIRLNALLQSASFNLKCYVDGRIESSTSGNELAKTKYKGYNRKMNTYELLIDGEIYYITNREAKSAKKHAEELRAMLDRQKQLSQQAKDPTESDENDQDCEIYNFLKSLD